MTYLVVIFLAVATYVLLSVIGGERVRRVQDLDFEMRQASKPKPAPEIAPATPEKTTPAPPARSPPARKAA